MSFYQAVIAVAVTSICIWIVWRNSKANHWSEIPRMVKFKFAHSPWFLRLAMLSRTLDNGATVETC
jgi:hypothetical protein